MDAKSKRAPLIIVCILAGAFVLRLGAAFWWQSRLPAGVRFAFGDSESYWVLAESIAHGGPYQYGSAQVFRTPGYPLLLAPLFWIRDPLPVMWARAEGAVFGTLAVAAVMWLARDHFGPIPAYLAGAAVAIYPSAIATSIFVLSEAPYCPLLLLQIACWVFAFRATDRQTLTAGAILAGLASGAATLVRPSHLLFTPFALALAMLAPGRRRNLLIGALMLAGFAVTMSPWWWRNYRLTGRFVPTTLQVGASLYDGLNPRAHGASDMSFVREFIEAQRQADAAKPRLPAATFEQRLDERMRDAAISWAKENPRQVCQLAFIKFVRMWNPLPNAAEFQSWYFRLAIFLGYTPLMACALWGAWRHLRGGWPYLLCVAPAVYLTLLHMVFVSSIRYREPAMLPLIVLAAGGWHGRRLGPHGERSD